jgi:hypothetical protein
MDSADKRAMNLTDATTWPEFLSPLEVAAVLRLTPDAIRRKLRTGELPGRKIGQDGRYRAEWRTAKTDLIAYVRGHDCP